MINFSYTLTNWRRLILIPINQKCGQNSAYGGNFVLVPNKIIITLRWPIVNAAFTMKC